MRHKGFRRSPPQVVSIVEFGELAQSATQPHIPLEDLSLIDAPTLVLVGDDDIVSLEHTIALFRAITNSELAVVPATSHTAMMEKPELVNQLILDFIEQEPVPTLLPMRRASAEDNRVSQPQEHSNPQ